MLIGLFAQRADKGKKRHFLCTKKKRKKKAFKENLCCFCSSGFGYSTNLFGKCVFFVFAARLYAPCISLAPPMACATCPLGVTENINRQTKKKMACNGLNEV